MLKKATQDALASPIPENDRATCDVTEDYVVVKVRFHSTIRKYPMKKVIETLCFINFKCVLEIILPL